MTIRLAMLAVKYVVQQLKDSLFTEGVLRSPLG
jgi:hypothetical protein